MSDPIDRQAAIDAIDVKNVHKGIISALQSIIRELPPAQPQSTNDCISRRDAILIVDSIDTWQSGWRGDAIESMKALPSVQPDTDAIHLQKEQAYMQGWEDGRKALRTEIWEDGRDRLN